MASLKDLRDRIASIKATQKITKAMQMVASAKLRRAREAAEAARPYAQRMAAVLADIAENVGADEAPALIRGTGKDDVHLLVVCTADRGLCGAFNSSIAREARDHIRKLQAQNKTVKIITVGKKGYDILRRDFESLIIDTIDFRDAKQINFSHADRVTSKIKTLFNEEAFDICTLFYSRFRTVIHQVPQAQQLIPAATPKAHKNAEETAARAIYDYEPDAASILHDLVPRNLAVQVYSALLENVAGEMGAKMSAMDNATRNAGDMIDKLSITYNRRRQSQITTELIEIIAGAEAL